MKKVIVFAISILFIQHFLLSKDYDITTFGAMPGGEVLNTKFIQNAIDQAHGEGGGRVVVPAGRFLCGSIQLKSGVTLHLMKGAVLLGSTQVKDYQKLIKWKALVQARDQENIAITGSGTIDGQGRQLALHVDSLFYAGQMDSLHYDLSHRRPKEFKRPQCIEMIDCKNVRIVGIRIQNSASWVQKYDRCENLVLDSLQVVSDAYWNNDGMDIVDCKNVRITHCFVDAADDGICIKSHSYDHFNDSILISDCVVRSSASAVKFGTLSKGGFRNVHIRNIRVYDTFRSAIAIESVDGGVLENVLVENIEATNTGNAIFIRLGHRNGKRSKNNEVGQLRQVVLRNIKAEIAFERPDYAYDVRGPALPFFHNIFPASITGIPGHPVQEVVLENIEVIYPGRGNRALAYSPLERLAEVPEAIADYPEFSMFGELPAWGLYVRHVENLALRNIKFTAKQADYRPAMVFDDVRELELSEIHVKGSGTKNQTVFKAVKEDRCPKELSVQRLD